MRIFRTERRAGNAVIKRMVKEKDLDIPLTRYRLPDHPREDGLAKKFRNTICRRKSGKRAC